jgi:hypothetical protein
MECYFVTRYWKQKSLKTKILYLKMIIVLIHNGAGSLWLKWSWFADYSHFPLCHQGYSNLENGWSLGSIKKQEYNMISYKIMFRLPTRGWWLYCSLLQSVKMLHWANIGLILSNVNIIWLEFSRSYMYREIIITDNFLGMMPLWINDNNND